MEELDSDARALLAAYWWRRAAGEMTSSIGWRHVLLDLHAEGSPAPVIALAERAVADEHRHALWCRDWAVSFGHTGGEVAPRAQSPVALGGATEKQNRLLRIALACFTETVGCFTLQHVRRVVSNPALRKFNRRHLSDELQHSRAGWAHLSVLGREDREFVRDSVPMLLSWTGRACCAGDEQDREDLVPFGYFTPRLLRAACDEALEAVILPGLDHLGIGGRA